MVTDKIVPTSIGRKHFLLILMDEFCCTTLDSLDQLYSLHI